ncbi:hypothetical protein BHU62_19455 [Serratia marcescens]|uniref:Uncharacterized protein n=1 Tax=Serratia marcescens TaxID=615 RepID=A0A1Q4NW21_SERMA|nr:hypothetical protein [Serratia marcescens]OKB65082.1 hypothetical protein BHU62_19455 [Serratia marcescens]
MKEILGLYKAQCVTADSALAHIQQNNMRYLGIYGRRQEASVKKRQVNNKGGLISPVYEYQLQDIVFGRHVFHPMEHALVGAAVISRAHTL